MIWKDQIRTAMDITVDSDTVVSADTVDTVDMADTELTHTRTDMAVIH